MGAYFFSALSVSSVLKTALSQSQGFWNPAVLSLASPLSTSLLLVALFR